MFESEDHEIPWFYLALRYFCLADIERVDKIKNESGLDKCSSLIIVPLQVIYIPRAGYNFFI